MTKNSLEKWLVEGKLRQENMKSFSLEEEDVEKQDDNEDVKC